MFVKEVNNLLVHWLLAVQLHIKEEALPHLIYIANRNRGKVDLHENEVFKLMAQKVLYCTSSMDSVVDLIVVTTVLFLKSSAEINTKIPAIAMEAVTMMAQM